MAAPNGLIVGWPSTVGSIPAGWSRVTAMDSRYPRGTSTATGTGGSNTHQHNGAAHQHTAQHAHYAKIVALTPGIVNVDWPSGVASVDADNNHRHVSSTGSEITTTDYTALSASAGGAASDSDSSEPAHYTVIWIISDGTTDIPVSSIGWLPGGVAAPANHTKCRGSGGTPDLRNVFLRGAAAAGNGGTLTPAAAHDHVVSHSHTFDHDHPDVSGSSSGEVPSAGKSEIITAPITTLIIPNHTHNYTAAIGSATVNMNSAETSATTSVDPPWQKIDHIQKTGASSDIPSGYIGAWNGALGSVPANWSACDGTAGTPDLNGNIFLKGAATNAENGTTGGSATHSHDYTHTHDFPTHEHSLAGSSTGNPSTSQNVKGGGYGLGMDTHSHTFEANTQIALPAFPGSAITSLAAGSTTSTPAYYDVIFIMRAVELKTDTDNNAINTIDGDSTEFVSVVADDADSAAINVTEVSVVASISVSITSPTPDEVKTASSFNVNWSVSGGTQATYRLIIATTSTINPDDASVIYDTGTEASALGTATIPIGTVQTGQSYYVAVFATDTLGLQAWSTPVHFTTSFAPKTAVEGLRCYAVGNNCGQNDPLPHVRIEWDEVTPSTSPPVETFLRYNILRRAQGETEWVRIGTETGRHTIHHEDYAGIPGEVYEYAVTWSANTSGGVLTSAPQDAPCASSVDFEWTFLHEQRRPSRYVRLEAIQHDYDWDLDIEFSRAWGRDKPTAFVGEGFSREVKIDSLVQIRRDPRRWRDLEELIGRQRTAGRVLVLRVGIDKTRTFVQGTLSTSAANAQQWAASLVLREVYFEEEV